MERRVEHRDVRDVRQRALCGTDRLQRRFVVERRERPELLDRGENGLVDHGRLAEAGAAMDDAMADRAGRHIVIDVLGLAAFDEMTLEARRARVDDENPQRPSRNGGYSSRIRRAYAATRATQRSIPSTSSEAGHAGTAA